MLCNLYLPYSQRRSYLLFLQSPSSMADVLYTPRHTTTDLPRILNNHQSLHRPCISLISIPPPPLSLPQRIIEIVQSKKEKNSTRDNRKNVKHVPCTHVFRTLQQGLHQQLHAKCKKTACMGNWGLLLTFSRTFHGISLLGFGFRPSKQSLFRNHIPYPARSVSQASSPEDKSTEHA